MCSEPSEIDVNIQPADINEWYQVLPSGSSGAESSHESEDGGLFSVSSETCTTDDETCSGISMNGSDHGSPIIKKIGGTTNGTIGESLPGENKCI